MTGPSSWATIPEVIQAARACLSPEVWDFSAGGADAEVTLRRNTSMFEYLAFRPRILRDVSRLDTSTTFLGVPLDLPIMLAPVGSIALFDADGALACARAARQRGTALFISCLASPSMEVVTAGSDAPWFFQLFFTGQRPGVHELVRRSEDAGCRGICLTVDGVLYGRRERDLRHRFRPPERDRPNMPAGAISRSATMDHPGRAAATWKDVEWLRSVTALPLMIKGIMGPEDARLAVEHGADVVYVSNHGGRQLDHAPATIEVLADVVDAVTGRALVLMDGGITRGTDVLKALALGANAVTIGKLMTWGLAAGGVEGVARTLELLGLEMRTVMANLGVSSVTGLTRDHLQASVPPRPGGLQSLVSSPHRFSSEETDDVFEHGQ